MSTPRGRRWWFGAATAVSVAIVVLAALPGVAQQGTSTVAGTAVAEGVRSASTTYDARAGVPARMRQAVRAARLLAHAPPALRRLDASLGVQGVVQLDPITGTPRIIAKLNGFLSAPRAGSARAVAMDYLRAHEAAFGITDATLGTLTFVRDYVSIDGTHHLAWTQRRAGIDVFGSGLRINVTKDGRVINVLGSPVADLSGVATAPTVPAARAISTAVADAKLTNVIGLPAVTRSGTIRRTSPTATRVFFPRSGGTRLAWQTYLWGRQGLFLSIVDARTGAILYRQSLTDDARGSVFENYPHAPKGGAQHTVNLNPYVFARNRLFGDNAWVTTDVNDDNVAQKSEEVRPRKDGDWTFPFVPFTNRRDSPCVVRFPCSWDSRKKGGYSWRTNRRQSATQLFWFLNRYHQHLRAAPIGFTQAAGNFEVFNGSGHGFGGDPVLGQALDGANTLNLGSGLIGLPDFDHTDNANMSTPPDGFAPTMQMYLWNDPLTNIISGPGFDPYVQSNGADEADIVFHEYTHGLSNRLVVDPNGVSTLGTIQAGAMGEAWSDWYAMDYLVNRGLFTDTAAPGQLRLGQYVGAGQDLLRTEPMDCPVGSTSPRCPGTTGTGGYTYGDFGKVVDQVEVHADGEIWAQTLWDLRRALGSKVTEGLVTRAMELSPSNPSFLDERNAILQADEVLHGGSHQTRIWQVFAHRGMGYFASSIDGDDTQPVENFSMPPAPGSPTGTLSGTVRDSETADPIEGAVVAFGGHASGFVGDLAAVTDAAGHYSIPNIFVHTYGGVSAAAAGYDRSVDDTVAIAAGTNTKDWSLDRDWASASGGASIASFNGPNYTTFGCGPGDAIDQSLGNGWGSTTGNNNGDETGSATPKRVVIALPVAVDISSITIDPGHTCGDGLSASTHDYTVETSANGTTWSQVAAGTFFSGDVGTLNTVPLGGTTTGVNFVRFSMLDPMVPLTGDTCDDGTNCPPGGTGLAARCGPAASDPGAFDGCSFMDMSEIEVYGTPS